MTDTLRSILVFLVDIGILIFIHELGHYLAARSQGVVVEAFSIGFGPALVSWRSQKTGTVWKISALPLGGYVKMQGWGEDRPADGPVAPGSFSAASLRSKALIVAAGPVANILLAFVLFAGLFMTVGQLVARPVFSEILPNSPAAAAHLQPGDRVIKIGDTKIHDFQDLLAAVVPHPDQTLTFQIDRDGATIVQAIKLGHTESHHQTIGHLGVKGEDPKIVQYGPWGAIVAAGSETWQQTTGILTGLYNLVVHRTGLSELSGPLGIAEITGQAAAIGFITVVNLVALLSINLGLINLVPIPILDGGHLLFYAIEAVIRRPIPPRAQEVGLRFGVAVILSLFFVTTLNDLTRLGAVSWVSHLFG